MAVLDLSALAAAVGGSGEPYSPEWWRARLITRIAARTPLIDKIERYCNGEHNMAFATSKFREAFGELLKPLRDDWMQIVVEAATERLKVEGFRFGAKDTKADVAAWEIWQANGLDARAGLGHDEAVKFGAAYAVVSPAESDEDPPRILVIPPSRAAVEHDPSQPMRRLAGLHTWCDADGANHAMLWTPEGWWEWGSDAPGPVPAWELVEQGTNEIGVVPIVPLANRPTLRQPDGRSDVLPVMPMNDAINKLLADLMVASEFAAFRQRWMTGVEIPTDPQTGEQLDSGAFIASLSRVWTIEGNEDGSPIGVGEFSATDLSNYVKPIELIVSHISAQTRTPPHYLMGSIVNASADALRAAEAGLVSRVRAKMLTFGEGWEEAMRIAFAWKGDERRSEATACEAIWRDPETRTEGERVDAITKLQTVGVPQEALWARIPGVSPQEIERWRTMRDQDAVAAGLTLGRTTNGAPVEPTPSPAPAPEPGAPAA